MKASRLFTSHKQHAGKLSSPPYSSPPKKVLPRVEAPGGAGLSLVQVLRKALERGGTEAHTQRGMGHHKAPMAFESHANTTC
eukprot:scaffold24464_cov36-Tisochrysis_lutea.AAC.1